MAPLTEADLRRAFEVIERNYDPELAKRSLAQQLREMGVTGEEFIQRMEAIADRVEDMAER